MYPVTASEAWSSEPAYNNPALYNRVYDMLNDEMITIDRAVLEGNPEQAYEYGRRYHLGATWNTSSALLVLLGSLGPVFFAGPLLVAFGFNATIIRINRKRIAEQGGLPEECD